MWVLLLILKIILYLFLVILLLLITFLVVPFSYQAEAAVMEGVSYSYRIGWFWNLFCIRGSRSGEKQTIDVYLVGKKLFKSNKAKREKEKPEEEKKENKERDTGNNLKSMFDMEFIKETLKYIKKIIGQVKPKHLKLMGVYGFEDPSLTGMTAGFIYTLQEILPQSKIKLQPCFVDEVFEIEAELDGRVFMGMIIYDTVSFFLKPDIKEKFFKKKSSKKVKPKAK